MFQPGFQRLHQQHAVGQSGQRIVMGHMFELLRHIAYLPQTSALQYRLTQRFDGGRHIADLVPSFLKRCDDVGFFAGNSKCGLHQRRDRFEEMPGNDGHKHAGDGQDHDQRGERIIDQLALCAIKRVEPPMLTATAPMGFFVSVLMIGSRPI